MKTFYNLILMSLIVIASCRTTSSKDNETSIVSLTVLIPIDFVVYHSQITVESVDKKTKIQALDYTNFKIPEGYYNLSISLIDSHANVKYKSCDPGKSHLVTREERELRIDICEANSGNFVFTTLAQNDENSLVMTPPKKSTESTPNKIIAIPSVENNTVIDEASQLRKLANFSKLRQNNCFGLQTVVTFKNGEIVIGMEGKIEDKVIDSLTNPRCDIELNLPKPAGKRFSALTYSISYALDDKSLSQNLFLIGSARDEDNNLILPCTTYTLDTNSHSKIPFTCDFYEKKSDNVSVVNEKFRKQLISSCASESEKFVLGFTIAGPSKTIVTSMNVNELRIQVPTLENCPN
ncbi:MAG: hypothetical protein EOP07_03935 [Proteobacteria bacterium]|nr:MAG: hypothetical protein EOP07_03935 [Pseudomonadota bacterium]